MKTEFTHDGLIISPQDLSGLDPETEDEDRMFHHDGSSAIPIVGGGSDSGRGYYIWDADESAWYPLFRNADKVDGKNAGDFLWRDGSLEMEDDLNVSNNGIINLGKISGGTGLLDLNTNHVTLQADSSGSDVRLKDSDGVVLAEAIEGGSFNVPNGELSEDGDRVATRDWTNANAEVPQADHADNADNLDGEDASAFLHVSGDQMEGVLDLGLNNIEDGGDVVWDAVNQEITQDSLGGPASSLNAYPLSADDLAEDYALTSRFPLPASDLSEDYVETSRFPVVAGDLYEDYVLTSRLPLPADDLEDEYALTSRFPIPNSDLSNSTVTVQSGNQLTGGGSVGLGGTISIDVDESGLNADTLDGNNASAFADSGHLHDDRYVESGGDSLSGELILQDESTAASRSWVDNNADVPNADHADTAGDADTVDGKNASAFADAGHDHDERYYTETEVDSNFALSGHLHDDRYIQHTGEVAETLDAQSGILVERGSDGLDANNSIESKGSYLGLDTKEGATGGVLLGYFNAPEVRVGNGNLSDFNWNGDTVATRPWVNSNYNDYSDSQAADAAPIQTVNGETGDVTVDGFTASEAVDAVNDETSLTVDISGDADTLNGKTSDELGGISEGDPIPHPVYASESDVPSVSKGETVYIDGDGLYVEDGT